MKWTTLMTAGLAGLGTIAAHDALQRRHAILRNFPVIGHGRYLIEKIGPELRQYIVASNDEERPFTRDQRSWIYANSKLENAYVGFGTDNDVENQVGYTIFKHRTFADLGPDTRRHGDEEGAALPSAKVLGGPRGRKHAFRPNSVVNISGMSYGALSGNAISALNAGAAQVGSLHNTGEGGVSPAHLQGGDLIFQIGTAYFGCRDDQGRFDLDQLCDLVAEHPIKALEIKLSQGAKPGLGGMLPAAKITPEIAEIRGIPRDEDCASPARHTAFHDVDSMLDFVEMLADATGLPVGIKSAVGDLRFWDRLVEEMTKGARGVDFVNVDGGEGGTGAAPLVFSDHIAQPFRLGFAQVYGRFAEAELTDDVTFIGAGKLGLPDTALVAFALGADMVNVAREAMISVGCIQAQRCHTDHCPTGVATQNPWLVRGLDPELKAERCANYIVSLRRDLLKVSHAVGVHHPGMLTADDIDLVTGTRLRRSLRDVYEYKSGWGELGPDLAAGIHRLMLPQQDDQPHP